MLDINVQEEVEGGRFDLGEMSLKLEGGIEGSRTDQGLFYTNRPTNIDRSTHKNSPKILLYLN